MIRPTSSPTSGNVGLEAELERFSEPQTVGPTPSALSVERTPALSKATSTSASSDSASGAVLDPDERA
jgi:hypothetical protein